MDNFTYTITRQQVSSIVGRDLTDLEWQVMTSELNDLFDHYYKSEIYSITDELDVYVREYQEINS
jgi:hypothetical protein